VFERTPGRGRYAQSEREQRWLLRGLPDGLADPVEIVDKYLRASTLRLRSMRTRSTVVYKLGQKVRPNADRPSLVQMTNMYLTQPEFELLAHLEGAELCKTRWHWDLDGVLLTVDQFRGSLDGLVLAELELALEDARHPLPPFAIAEVTEDDRFSGGRLAWLDDSEAAELLAMVSNMTDLPTDQRRI
jgi:CYTH domain-containing protein